ncbi:efflux transporter outer membrane subunit [Nitrogeniibacter aestuarii]|uniref:efflux transporter outer membrane subunit n=1 Tax=Nitrogeniibacter aestuarii TaxID=2815343 RepID=UPI001E54A3F7|nr:efflux transporter outer membrane subunit [Nitrogeniibacter aestuarii]
MPPARTSARLASLTAAFLLVGCASVGPDYQRPTMAVPGAWQGHAPAQAPDVLAHWWQLTGDEQLIALVDAALAGSPTLAAAEARLRAARAQWRAAGADLGPTIEASGGASRSRGSRETGSSGEARSLYQAGFDARWEADLFGANRRALEAAEASAEVSRYSLADVQASLVAEVVSNYVLYRSTGQRLSIARTNLEAQSETLQITDWRVQAGLSASLALEQARANRAQTAAQIPALETTLAGYANALAVLCGQAPGALTEALSVDRPMPSIPAQVALGIPADLLRQRADLREAERTLAAATARIGAAQAQRYPSVTLSGSLGFEALSFGALGGAESLTRSLAASIAATLFDGGRLVAQVDLQRANRDEALENYRQAVLVALQDVEDALVAVRNGERRVELLAVAAESARNAALLARHQFDAGVADYETVLDTERTRLSAEDSHASARAELATARIQLIKALGGGWVPDAWADPADDDMAGQIS